MPFDTEAASDFMLSPKEAGKLLKQRRAALGMTQDQVIEKTGIPNLTQYSQLENGRVSLARSKYLPMLADVLKLTEEDIRSINPAAVVNLTFISAEENQAVGNLRLQPVQPTNRVYFRGEVFGDMHIPTLPAPFVMALYYDEKGTSGLILSTNAAGEYWLYRPERVPNSHTVLGAFAELHLEVDTSEHAAP